LKGSLLTEFLSSDTGITLGGGITLSGVQGISHLTSDLDIYASGTLNVQTTEGLTVSQLTTTSGLAIEHGPATISGLTIATEAYADQVLTDALESEMSYKGGYDAGSNSPDLDIAPSSIAKGDVYTVTASGLFFNEDVEVGDVLIAEIAIASGLAD